MSAYKGYLLKIGNWVVPSKFIRAQTYTVLRSGQDLDSYRDADGNLHRTALDNFLYKVEFETPPLQTDSFYEELWTNIKNQYVSTTEKKVLMECYVTEIGGYAMQYAYIPDVTQTIYNVVDGVVKYNQTRFAFIGYGKG